MSPKKLFPQLLAVVVLACFPLAGGVTVTHTLDESVKAVSNTDPVATEPPGVGLGAALGAELGGTTPG